MDSMGNFISTILARLLLDIKRIEGNYNTTKSTSNERPSAQTLLQDIYGKRSTLVVVFLSEDYQRKEWCGIEFPAIGEIIMKRDHDKIMFVRMDNANVDGVSNTTALWMVENLARRTLLVSFKKGLDCSGEAAMYSAEIVCGVRFDCSSTVETAGCRCPRMPTFATWTGLR